MRGPHSQSNSPRNSPKFPPRNPSRLLSTPSNQNGNYSTANLNLNGNNRRYYSNNNHHQDFNPPGTPNRSSGRHTATLLASLDKSILQIRDWLTLLESMIKKDRVDLANRANIYHMLERQKVRTLFFAFLHLSTFLCLYIRCIDASSKTHPNCFLKSLKALNSLELLSLLFFIAFLELQCQCRKVTFYAITTATHISPSRSFQKREKALRKLGFSNCRGRFIRQSRKDSCALYRPPLELANKVFIRCLP